MTSVQAVITIGVAVLATVITRFLPFVVFSEKRPLPKFMEYLGKVLPGAVFGLLVIYCFKGVSVLTFPFGLPEIVSVLAVVLLHLWKRNMLISVISGTVLYMVLVQVVFGGGVIN